MEEPSMNSKTRTFTSSEVIEITSNFETMIGKGGFGEVYHGTLKDGTDVAVKILLSSSEQCRKAFITEAKLLTDVHQLNLVSLVGYCDEESKEALILEYVSNGNLKQHLLENRGVLTWFQRLQIAFDVTRGLDYLHDHKPPIVHRDLKPNNILLNENLQAKIADFGLSKAFATESTSHLSTRPGGTPGYIDLDSYNTGQTRKGNDVYSFGIILLQLVIGKPAIITLDNGERINIFNWDPIKRRNIREIVDPRLNGEFNINVARKVIEIALSCVKPIKKRPDISHVLTKLMECLHIEMKSRALDKTAGRLKLLLGLSKNIRQKGVIMKSMEEQSIMKLMETRRLLILMLRNVGILTQFEVRAITKLRNVRIFTQIEVAIITSNFKKVIGQGESGKVYLGTLNDDTPVAVKIMSPESSIGLRHNKFQNEGLLLSRLDHRNVVSLVGYCDENNIKALIYEYLANGDLEGHLSGLEYLHTCCESLIVHRNLRPRVILLIENMQAKISGFGIHAFWNEVIATFGRHDEIKGTFEYLDPACYFTRSANKTADVYSFGVILAKLLTGQPSIVHMSVIINALEEEKDIKSHVDPRLHGKFNINSASKVAKLAMSCASCFPNRRPGLSLVLVELKECLALEMGSQQTSGDTNRHGRITRFR